MQGQLWKKPVAVTVTSECACCGRPLRFEVDAERVRAIEPGASPLAFFPIVDFSRWPDPSIIDGF
ncbi:MAG TPA: hypothetical protein VGQ83_35750 [Polyangia bacterium]